MSTVLEYREECLDSLCQGRRVKWIAGKIGRPERWSRYLFVQSLPNERLRNRYMCLEVYQRSKWFLVDS